MNLGAEIRQGFACSRACTTLVKSTTQQTVEPGLARPWLDAGGPGNGNLAVNF